MSTTTIRLPAELKQRLSTVAEHLGSSSHALILDAIEERVSSEEERHEAYAIAETRFAAIAETGQTIPWDDMKAYLQNRAHGQAVPAPTPRKLVR